MSSSLKARLSRLEQLGDPVRVVHVYDPGGTFDIAVSLTNGAAETVEIELDSESELLWMDAWQIIGCLVEHVAHEPVERDALLEAAKFGLDEVLDVRLRQLEVGSR